MSNPSGFPRSFILVRDQDISGISGTGIVAGGVLFPDGTACLRWYGVSPTSVVFHDNGIESILAVHGHNGATRIVFEAAEIPAGPVTLSILCPNGHEYEITSTRLGIFGSAADFCEKCDAQIDWEKQIERNRDRFAG